MRLAAYTGASVVLAAGVALRALHQRSNFYSAAVFISQNNANVMILINLCLVISGYALFGLQRLLYGRLRQIETEQLYEKAWFAVTETCLAMTIFRGEVGVWFVIMFVCLLAGKVWGWIGEGRVEYLEQQSPNNPRLFHTRLALSLAISVLFNSQMLEYAIRTVLRQARPDMMVMFGFEFAILTILSTSTMARYAIALTDIYITRQQKQAKITERRAEIRAERSQMIRQQAAMGMVTPSTENLPSEDDINEMELDVPGWEERSRWVFYLDLVTDFLKLVIYLSFFAILFTFYGLPIHILRDVVMTMRSFAKRIIDFIKYRNATRDMNERYPDATAEEIARVDVCIICREEMQVWVPEPAENAAAAPAGRPARAIPERLRAKRLPCGHLLHFSCLRSWLERQQNCPLCRQPVATGARGNTRAFEGRGAVAEGHRGGDQNQGGNGAGAAGGDNNRGRMWFLNFGPLRIGFGAGRGDLLQNFDMGQGQGQAAQAAGANQNPPAEQAQRIGFGFGIRRHAATGTTPAPTAEFNHRDVLQTIHQLEEQLMHEFASLANTTDQLRVIRELQFELLRLRNAQGNAPNIQGAGSVATALPNAVYAQHPLTSRSLPTSFSTDSQRAGSSSSTVAGPNATQTQPALTSRTFPSASTTQRHAVPNSQQNLLHPGDPRLPAGLTIPQGWSLVPVNSLPQANQSADLYTRALFDPATHAANLPPPSSSPLPFSAYPSLFNTTPTPPFPHQEGGSSPTSSPDYLDPATTFRPPREESSLSSSPDYLDPDTTFRLSQEPPTISATQRDPDSTTVSTTTPIKSRQQHDTTEIKPPPNDSSTQNSQQQNEDDDEDEEEEEDDDDDGHDEEDDDEEDDDNTDHKADIRSLDIKGKGRAVMVEDGTESE